MEDKKSQRERLLEQIRDTHPCFGHYSKMHCMNLGYFKFKKDHFGITQCEKCPFDKICRKETLKYAQDSDPYNEGKIDKPRDWIRSLKNEGRK